MSENGFQIRQFREHMLQLFLIPVHSIRGPILSGHNILQSVSRLRIQKPKTSILSDFGIHSEICSSVPWASITAMKAVKCNVNGSGSSRIMPAVIKVSLDQPCCCCNSSSRVCILKARWSSCLRFRKYLSIRLVVRELTNLSCLRKSGSFSRIETRRLMDFLVTGGVQTILVRASASNVRFFRASMRSWDMTRQTKGWICGESDSRLFNLRTSDF